MNNVRKRITLDTNLREVKFSAVILTKNEEDNIVDCLDSVLWCDEIIIVDDMSKDRTIEIVKNLKNKKIKIFNRSIDNDFSAQRNYALEKANGEWVLFVDADERISEGLRFEIEQIIAPQNLFDLKIKGFKIRRTDFLWGKQLTHGEAGNIKFVRLAKKNAGSWMGKVHEEWKINGKVADLKNLLYHYPHQSISLFLKEINYYTDIRAKELYDKKKNPPPFFAIIFPLGKFIFSFIFKRGFMDGIEGFIFAVLMSFHSFLVRGKLWILWQKK